jgi:subtilisin family serine protease
VGEQVVARFGVVPSYRFRVLFQGATVQLRPVQAALLAREPAIQDVTPDSPIVLSEAAASWGLDRVDQRTLPLNGLYWRLRRGAGVRIYIVDTGIRFSHAAFGGRAVSGYDVDGGDGSDCHGHGTHVAGTAGGFPYGLADQATLVAVKVFSGCGGLGSIVGLTQGLEWIVTDAAGRPAVANLSLGAAGVVQFLDEIVANLIRHGVLAVVAAGNSNADACEFSPARVRTALTIGATNELDARSGFSNSGRCLDIFGPGERIVSASAFSDEGTATKNGTSMATPHATGTAALYLAEHPVASPREVAREVTQAGTVGVLSNLLAGSGRVGPNLLLYVAVN